MRKRRKKRREENSGGVVGLRIIDVGLGGEARLSAEIAPHHAIGFLW